jgi:aminoglycoside phosphotransferase (APT) family kinase protein
LSLTQERDLDMLRSGLERWLGRRIGTISRPDPGWSCETLVVDDEFVVRLPPLAEGIFPTYDLEQQAQVQQAAADSGVPVPSPVRYEADPAFLGAPFIAMPFVVGAIPLEFTPSDPWLSSLPDDGSRRRVWISFLEVVAKIHRVRPPGTALRTGIDAELDYWDRYVSWASDGKPPTSLADSLAWCRANRPAHEPPSSMLWGDVRLGNVIFDTVALAPKALLDWDMASVGPAEMDVGWFVALEQVQSRLTGMKVSGFGLPEEAVALVEEAEGRSLFDRSWYEIFALVRASAVSTRIAILFQRAGRRSMFKVGEDPTLVAASERIARLEASS